jgi:hypothetical protein
MQPKFKIILHTTNNQCFVKVQKLEKNDLSQYSYFFEEKSNLEKKIGSHLGSIFSLVAFFKLEFLLCEQDKKLATI